MMDESGYEAMFSRIEKGVDELFREVIAGAKIAGETNRKFYERTRLWVRNALFHRKMKCFLKDLGEEMSKCTSESVQNVFGNKKLRVITGKVKDCENEIILNHEKMGLSSVEEEKWQIRKNQETRKLKLKSRKQKLCRKMR